MKTTLAIATAFVLLTVSPVAAEELSFFGIKFDGPQITGVIDTTADTLFVTSWTENAGGDPFWTPHASEFPLPLVANFDVPDGWDGALPLAAKFDSGSKKVSAYQWNEGVSTGNHILELGDTTLISEWSGQSINGIGPNALSNWLFDTVTVRPIPEPTTSALALAALCLAIHRRRIS